MKIYIQYIASLYLQGLFCDRSTMGSTAELQALLRFLAQDAKIPLAAAMGNVKALQKADLAT